jgi:3'-5' exoribonuclease Rv2179c-like domain
MDFMVDLETLGSGPTSVVVQIGIVAFDLFTGEAKADTLININPTSELSYRFTVDGDTIIWWMEQAALGRCTWASGGLDSMNAWDMYCAFIKTWGNKNCRVWSHSTFDAPIITHHLNTLRIQQPVHYNRYVDLRTISMLAKGLLSIPKSQRPEGRHDARTDCLYQVEWLVKCWNKLRSGG